MGARHQLIVTHDDALSYSRTGAMFRSTLPRGPRAAGRRQAASLLIDAPSPIPTAPAPSGACSRSLVVGPAPPVRARLTPRLLPVATGGPINGANQSLCRNDFSSRLFSSERPTAAYARSKDMPPWVVAARATGSSFARPGQRGSAPKTAARALRPLPPLRGRLDVMRRRRLRRLPLFHPLGPGPADGPRQQRRMPRASISNERLVDACLDRAGLKPFQTLYHWEMASALADARRPDQSGCGRLVFRRFPSR